MTFNKEVWGGKSRVNQKQYNIELGEWRAKSSEGKDENWNNYDF